MTIFIHIVRWTQKESNYEADRNLLKFYYNLRAFTLHSNTGKYINIPYIRLVLVVLFYIHLVHALALVWFFCSCPPIQTELINQSEGFKMPSPRKNVIILDSPAIEIRSYFIPLREKLEMTEVKFLMRPSWIATINVVKFCILIFRGNSSRTKKCKYHSTALGKNRMHGYFFEFYAAC